MITSAMMLRAELCVQRNRTLKTFSGAMLQPLGRGVSRRAVGNDSDPVERQQDRETATSALLAGDDQFALMPDQHVLYDRKAQPGTAGGPGTAAIDAVEALGQSRHMFGRDTDAAVRDREFAAGVGDPPFERNASALGRVAHGVADQIPERACKLFAAANQRR